jgi:hypothetical protein
MRDCPASMRARAEASAMLRPVGRMRLKNGQQKKPVFSQPPIREDSTFRTYAPRPRRMAVSRFLAGSAAESLLTSGADLTNMSISASTRWR